ncbi:MAG: DNA repair protein RecN [Treponema sp.]|nr:DNA repair protein RecN [Treponema sp.]
MLEQLEVKNFALIESVHIDFKSGFTVLSGETGAGKSILIGSLVFLLGGKSGMELIRSGCHEAVVSGIFSLDSIESKQWLSERGIENEDDTVILRRIIRDTGKTSSWIGSVPVTKSDLIDFASFLVDIHGQHEQQSLMKISEHRKYLDIYAGITDDVKAFSEIYNQLVSKRRILENLNSNEAERKNKIEMLTFAINEIDAAKLKLNEDSELEAEENRLVSFEKLYSDCEEIRGLFYGSDDSSGLIGALKRLNSIISHASELDANLSELSSRIQASFYELSDVSDEFTKYEDSLIFDPERLSYVQDRLETIYKLKKKYSSGIQSGISDVLSYAETARRELEELSGMMEDKSDLEKQIKLLETHVYACAKQLSVKRKSASVIMSEKIEEILSKLGMKNAKFGVSIAEKTGNEVSQKCSQFGMDDVEFLISTNPGTHLLPLARIASGGELSRVMLALKTILCDADTVATLIFDEVDTGVGGEIAVSIGEHLKKLSKKKQVLCITHLASIAVYADNQIKIQKGVDGNTAATNVFPVENQERIKEIARMLSGDSTSSESLEHATAMLHKFGGM